MLLDKAHLKAVISLPQGLFVSKNGQGPKTSILVFEKGGKTDWTWFYKVTNDGYTMGTNRKEQKGNQLVECLSLYHEFVKHGKKPAESKNQFCIPSEWVKTLDPRVKEKIRTETRADMEVKGKIEKTKKAEELDRKIKVKKITNADKQMELKVFDQMLENRIQNEIAKRIDKAYNYSFNFANYKSTISDSQISEWTEALKHMQPNGATTLDEVYKKLSNSKPENILPYLLKLNPANALEADIVREYVSNLDNDLILKHKELNLIKEILKSGAKYEREKLGNLMSLKRNVLKLENFNPDYRLVEKIRFKDGAMILRKDSETGIDLQFAEIGDLLISKINFNQGATAINNYGKVLTSLDYLVYEVYRSKAIPEFIHLMVRDKYFIRYVNESKPGGIKGRSKPEFIETLEIPLPSIDEQTTIIAQIGKQKAIIEGANKIEANFEFEFDNIYEWKREKLADCCFELKIGNTPTGKVKNEGEIVYLKVNNLSFDLSLDFKNEYYIDRETHNKDLKGSKCYTGDVLMNIVGPPLGKVSIVPPNIDECNMNQAIICFRPKEYLDSRFLAYYLLKKSTVNRFIENIRRSTGQWNLTKTICSAFEIDFPSIELQQKIVIELDSQMQIINGIRQMKTEAEKKIGKILAEVFGVEVSEPAKMEVEDE